ncbi:MAG TPA: hypothetical protein VN973_13390 [Candidatus Dormibacteraeota bacterium]|nr:hypothetical protein [Candidatus Dormibacteraeota bacterium]
MQGEVTYLGQAFIDFALRPVRLAYLIQDGSATSATAAIEEATSRWGGITEILLPYSDGGEIDPVFIAAARVNPPDHFTIAGDMPTEALRRKLEQQVGGSLVPLSDVQLNPFGGLHQLAVTPVDPPRRSLMSLPASASDPIVRQAACGVVRDDALANWRSYQAVQFVPDAMSSAMAQVAGAACVDGTRAQLDDLTGSVWRHSPAVVWVCAEASLQDAIDFWNTRASMQLGYGRMIVCAVTPEVLLDRSFGDALERALSTEALQPEPDIWLASATIDQAQCRELANAIGWEIFTENTLTVGFGGAIPDRKGSRKVAVRPSPLRNLLGSHRVGQSVRLLINLERARTVVASTSPVAFTRPIGGPIRARFSGTYDFSLPPGESVGKLFHPNAVAVGGAVELVSNTQALFEFHLSVPTRAKLLAASMRDAGMEVSASDKGLLAEGVMARMPDLEVLRHPFVQKCIEALTTHRLAYDIAELRKHFNEPSDVALEDIAGRLQNVRQVARPLRDIASRAAIKVSEAAPAIEVLVAAGIVRRGMLAECGTCGMSSFIELADVTQAIACPGCGSPAAVGTDPNRGESELYYRLNSLVDRASDNGVITHLLAVAALRRRDPKGHVNPGVNLVTSGGQAQEADLLALLETISGWARQRRVRAGLHASRSDVTWPSRNAPELLTTLWPVMSHWGMKQSERRQRYAEKLASVCGY